MSITRILLADDHIMLLEGIKLYLERQKDFRVIGMVQTGAEVMARISQEPVDVLIIDINMAESNGLNTLRQVKLLHPNTKVIVLSMYQEAVFVHEAMAAGADGYVFKSRAGKELITAITTVLDGDSFFPDVPPPPAAPDPFSETTDHSDTAVLHSLTKREKEILLLLCDDLSTKELADRLHTSVHTMETHRRNLLRKVGVRSVNGLVSFAGRNRLFLSEKT